KITWACYWGILTGRQLDNSYERYKNLGVFAIVRGAGYRPDGQLLICQTYADEDPVPDHHFQQAFDELKTPGWGISADNGVDESRLQQLQELLAFCDAHHIRVLSYLTPMSPTIYNTLTRDPATAAWLNDLDQRLKVILAGRDYFNFMNAAAIGSSDCE